MNIFSLHVPEVNDWVPFSVSGVMVLLVLEEIVSFLFCSLKPHWHTPFLLPCFKHFVANTQEKTFLGVGEA